MRTIIAGSRTILDKSVVYQAIAESHFEITEVVCGKAKGPDSIGETWAIENNLPVKYFTANWANYGRAAGILRNKQMGDYADALIAIWDGRSKGTAQMIEYARKRGLKVFVCLY